jgi:Peptidase M15
MSPAVAKLAPLTPTEYLMGRGDVVAMPVEHVKNMNQLLAVVSGLLADFGERRKIVSGYRRPEDNAACGGSPRSNHLTCAAVDLEDKNGKLKAWLSEEELEKYGLFMEHPAATPSWCHLQLFPPRSGAIIFHP